MQGFILFIFILFVQLQLQLQLYNTFSQVVKYYILVPKLPHFLDFSIFVKRGII